MRRFLIISLLIGFIGVSCERQKIYEPEFLNANIPILIDWSKSLVPEGAINNVSVHCYPVDGSEPTVTISGDPYLATVTLSEGIYDIIVHNEIAGNITGVDCCDCDCMDDYTMMIQGDDASGYTMYYELKDGEQLIKESEAVGSWCYHNFEVTSEMIEYTRSESFASVMVALRSNSESRTGEGSSDDYVTAITRSYSEALENSEIATRSITKALDDLNGIEPAPLTSTYRVSIEIDNMNNAQYIEGEINGFVDGAEVASGDLLPSDNTNVTRILFTEHTFDEGSTTNGEVYYTFSNFGHTAPSDGELFYLTINIILHSGEKYTTEIDITDQILAAYISGDISVNIGDIYNNGTHTIVLPENPGAGFGVSDWGDAQNVEL